MKTQRAALLLLERWAEGPKENFCQILFIFVPKTLRGMQAKTMEMRGTAGFRNIRLKPYAGAMYGGLGIFFFNTRARA